jgi:hypothetical protein
MTLGACIGNVLMMFFQNMLILIMIVLCCKGRCCLLGRAIVVLLHEFIILKVYMHMSQDGISLLIVYAFVDVLLDGMYHVEAMVEAKVKAVHYICTKEFVELLFVVDHAHDEEFLLLCFSRK